jgi:hypothetical protein
MKKVTSFLVCLSLIGCFAGGSSLVVTEGPFEPGIYSGTAAAVLTVANEAPVTQQTSGTVVIGTAGMPVISGQELDKGSLINFPVGPLTIQFLVTDLSIIDGSLIVYYSATASLTMPDNSIMTLTGQAASTYKMTSNNGIGFNLSVLLADVETYQTLNVELSGTFYK